MTKLPKTSRELIALTIDKLYESLKEQFLGKYVKTSKGIRFIFSPATTLAGLFNQASQEENVKPDEATLETLTDVASSYLDANRERTKARTIREITSSLNDARTKGEDFNLEVSLSGKLIDIFGDAKNHIQQIVGAETNSAKNLGVLDGILAFNSAAGVDDPTVAFIVARRVSDDAPCEECIKLHTTNGIGSPPKLWKLSEVSQGYHQKGEEFPSIHGLHPMCRCAMITVLPGYGYREGDSLRYINPGHDELALQRGK